MIELPADFRDLLLALHDTGAEFVVLGGHAVAFHVVESAAYEDPCINGY